MSDDTSNGIAPGGLRDSSRSSFVRSKEVTRHMRAHAAATRVAAARERTKRVTMRLRAC